jgi:hypothetical protein
MSDEADYIAAAFHTAYEALAPEHGYATRPASAVTWDEVPEPNRSLMVATVRYLLSRDYIAPGVHTLSRLAADHEERP